MIVTGVTVSYKILDKSFGSGTEHYVSIQAQASPTETGIPMEDQGGVLVSVSNQLLLAFRAVQDSRYQSGEMSGSELKEVVQKAQQRHNRLVDFLSNEEA